MKTITKQIELLTSITKDIKREKSEVQEVEADFLTNFIDFPFEGSLEGIVIYTEPNFELYRPKLGQLIDDTIRVILNIWAYGSQTEKQLNEMQEFAIDFANKYPKAKIMWQDDGSMLETITVRHIKEVFDELKEEDY